MSDDVVRAIAKIDFCSDGGKFLRYTCPEIGCDNESMEFHAESKIIEALNLQPDDEVVVVFIKRTKHE